jgi:DNA-binding NarL/FixJ family response regulator
VELKTVTNGEALAAEAASEPALVIVDLNARCDAAGAIGRWRAAGNEARVVAFVSHVQTELAERARAAGGAEVMPRSKFTRELATLLAQAKSG